MQCHCPPNQPCLSCQLHAANDRVAQLETQVSILQAELAKHEQDLADAASELMVPVPEPNTLVASLVRANRILRSEKANAISGRMYAEER